MENEIDSLRKKNRSLAASLAHWKKKYDDLNDELGQSLKQKERECQSLKVDLEICRKTRFRAKTRYVKIQDADLGI